MLVTKVSTCRFRNFIVVALRLRKHNVSALRSRKGAVAGLHHSPGLCEMGCGWEAEALFMLCAAP